MFVDNCSWWLSPQIGCRDGEGVDGPDIQIRFLLGLGAEEIVQGALLFIFGGVVMDDADVFAVEDILELVLAGDS